MNARMSRGSEGGALRGRRKGCRNRLQPNGDATNRNSSGRAEVLARLTVSARMQGLKIDKAALAFMEGSRPAFYGTPDLVRFLCKSGVPRWTHWIDDN